MLNCPTPSLLPNMGGSFGRVCARECVYMVVLRVICKWREVIGFCQCMRSAWDVGGSSRQSIMEF